jgi:hypothetical protein
MTTPTTNPAPTGFAWTDAPTERLTAPAPRRDPLAFEIDTISRAPRLETGERPEVDAARLWTGGVATAVVVALIGLVGTLIARVLEQLVPHAGTVVGAAADNQATILLCTLAAVAALAATGIAHLLLVSTPRPLAYLGWIVGLGTAVATVLPLTTAASPVTGAATAIIHLVIGLAIGSLVAGSRGRRHPVVPTRCPAPHPRCGAAAVCAPSRRVARGGCHRPHPPAMLSGWIPTADRDDDVGPAVHRP